MMNRSELHDIIKYEKNQYRSKFGLLSRFNYLKALIFLEPVCGIMCWQVFSRKCDYYSNHKIIVGRVLGQVYRFLRNYYGRRMNIEASTTNIGKGLLIYHTGGIIINSAAKIGENVHFHGMNCVGNAGEIKARSVKNCGCPIIGNNVTIGVGASVIGDIEIADGITIGAGAVVVKSFREQNINIAGVPAKKITHL